MFVGALAGAVPLRQFMSPRTMVRLVGVGGFARLAFGRSGRSGLGRTPRLSPAGVRKLPGVPQRTELVRPGRETAGRAD